MSKVRQNAIDGFEGGTGIMPAKGGRLDLSDEEIIVLVDYMVEASR
jgi:cytochrome c5